MTKYYWKVTIIGKDGTKEEYEVMTRGCFSGLAQERAEKMWEKDGHDYKDIKDVKLKIIDEEEVDPFTWRGD